MIREITEMYCDVCGEQKYSNDSMTKVSFSRNGDNFIFDCCWDCFRGNEKVRKVYRKILSFFGKKHE